MSSGGGSGSSNTVTSVQQIPEFEQESSRSNQALAQSIGSQPYPVYQGALIQGMDPLQQTGQQLAIGAASAQNPYLQQATGTTVGALQSGANVNALTGMGINQVGAALDPSGLNAYSNAAASSGNAAQGMAGAAGGAAGSAGGAARYAQALTNPNAVGAYMSPFIGQALAPQIQQLGLQLGQQQKAIDAQSTQANAFGDARQGVAQSLQNYYGNQALNELIGTGYNNAYSQALSALGQAQNTNLGAAGAYNSAGGVYNSAGGLYNNVGSLLSGLAGLQGQEQQTQLAGAKQYGDLASILGTEQQTQLAGGQQLAEMGSLAQQLGLSGANAVYNAGGQNQQLQQAELNAAYQQYLNQINWPVQMLNVRESALSNSPYNLATAVTLPQGNSVAQGVGGGINIASILAQLAGSGSGGNAPYSGTKI